MTAWTQNTIQVGFVSREETARQFIQCELGFRVKYF